MAIDALFLLKVMDVFPFTPAPLEPWAWVGVAIGLLIGVPAFLWAFVGYLMENIRGRPPREELDRINR